VPKPISKPSLYIIAGPNGAGKTTFARTFLPLFADCLHFVNADLMLEEIHRLGAKKHSFSFETTLSGRSYLPMLRGLRQTGYAIHLFFLWVEDVKLALARIAGRVAYGGHNVPEPVVRRRFDRGLLNLVQLYRPVLDSWAVFDNSIEMPRLIVSEEGGVLCIHNSGLFAKLSKVVSIE
jgi:predicted ABC-type ATPase